MDSISNNDSVTVTLADSGNIGVTGSYRGSVSIWDLQNRPLPKTRNTHHHSNIVSLTHAGSHVTSVDSASTTEIAVWALDNVVEPSLVVRDDQRSISCVLHVAGTMLTGHIDGSITHWSTDMTSIDSCYRGHVTTVTSMAVTNDNLYLMSGDGEGGVVTWTLADRAQVARFTDHKMPIVGICYPSTNTDEYMVTVDRGGTMVVKDYRTARVVRIIELSRRPTCLSVQGGTVVVGSDDGSLEAWHIPQGGGDVIRGHHDAVTGVHFLNSCHIVSVSADKSIGLWSVSDGSCVSRFVVDHPITSSCLHDRTLTYGCNNGYLGMVHIKTHSNDRDHPILHQLVTNTQR